VADALFWAGWAWLLTCFLLKCLYDAMATPSARMAVTPTIRKGSLVFVLFWRKLNEISPVGWGAGLSRINTRNKKTKPASI